MLNRVLITGGTGYLGFHVAGFCLAQGWDVHLLVRPSFSYSMLESILDQVKIHNHDGTTEHLIDIMHLSTPDVVLHLAAHVVGEHRAVDVAPIVQANILLGVQILEAMSICGVKHFINTGTFWQHYGDASYDPVCLYAATKQAFEDVLAYYVNCRGMRAITLTLFDTYGPNDPRPKLLNLLAAMYHSPRSGQKPIALTSGEQLLDLVNVHDVATAYTTAAKLICTQAVRDTITIQSLREG